MHIQIVSWKFGEIYVNSFLKMCFKTKWNVVLFLTCWNVFWTIKSKIVFIGAIVSFMSKIEKVVTWFLNELQKSWPYINFYPNFLSIDLDQTSLFWMNFMLLKWDKFYDTIVRCILTTSFWSAINTHKIHFHFCHFFC